MKTYRDQMHGLQFTPEQKAAMVDALLAASQPFWPPVRPLTSGARSPAKPFCSRRWPRR